MKNFGAALLLVLACTACTTHTFVADVKHPEVSITAGGRVEYRGRTVSPDDLPGLLKDAGTPPSETVNILVPADLKDFRMPYYVMGVLSRNGFRRPILVKERRSYTVTGSDAHAAGQPGARTVDGRLKPERPVTQRRPLP